MLKSKELGAAIASAIQLKIDAGFAASKAAVARDLGVNPNVVYGWIRTGSISKERLPMLWEYFSDVVGPEHWGIPQRGMNFFQNTRRTDSTWPFELTKLEDILNLTPQQLQQVDHILAGVLMGLRSHPPVEKTTKSKKHVKSAA